MTTLTNKLGTFRFDDNVQLSHAKLIRDSITGQYFAPRRNTVRLTDEDSCYEFAATLGYVLGPIEFELEIRPEVREFSREEFSAQAQLFRIMWVLYREQQKAAGTFLTLLREAMRAKLAMEKLNEAAQTT